MKTFRFRVTAKYKIEKGIPLPSGRSKYPLQEMEVSDSFLIETSEENFASERTKISQALTYYHNTTNKKFTSRKVDEGIRIWRTK